MKQKIDIGTYHIMWDDTWHRIEVNGYFLRLSPTQYRICRAFVVSIPSPVPLLEEMNILAYQSYQKLQVETELPRELLTKHISNLNARMIPLGLQLRSFQTGYLLTFISQKAQYERQNTYRR